MQESSTRPMALDYRRIDFSAAELFDSVWRRKWLMAGCIAASLLLGVAYLYYAQPSYAVKARVLVQSDRWPLNEVTNAKPEKEFLATQAEIISSPAVIERVVPLVNTYQEIAQELDPLLTIQQRLAVSPVTGTNVLGLSYDCRIPDEGIATVRAVLDSYQQFLQELNDNSRLESLRLLTRSEERLRSELEEREAAYLELRKQSPLIGQDREVTTLQRALLENLAEAVSQARRHRIELENRVELLVNAEAKDLPGDLNRHEVMKVVSRASDPESLVPEDAADSGPAGSLASRSDVGMPVALSDLPVPSATEIFASVDGAVTQEYELISRELLKAQVREEHLLQHCGPEHPDLRAARKLTASWRARLQSLAEHAPVTLQRELSVAMNHERQLVTLYEQELKAAKENDDYLVKQKLELEGIDRLKSIHASVVAQMNDWQLVEPGEDGGMGVKVVVLQPPTIGAGPVWPKKPMLLSLCVAVGALTGLGIVVATKSPGESLPVGDHWLSTADASGQESR